MKSILRNPFTLHAAAANHVQAQNSLRRWNIILAVLYALIGIATLLITEPQNIGVYLHFLTRDSLSSAVAGQTVLAPATHQLLTVNVVYGAALLLLAAAAYHALLASSLRAMYDADLRRGVNRLRWLEYGFCGGLVLVILASVAGVRDIASLVALYGLVIVSGLMVWVLEVRAVSARQREEVLSLKISAVVAALLPWLIAGLYVVSSLIFGVGSLPSHIKLLLLVTLILYIAEAANIYLQRNKQGLWANYYAGERISLVLRFVIKFLLAGCLIAGVVTV